MTEQSGNQDNFTFSEAQILARLRPQRSDAGERNGGSPTFSTETTLSIEETGWEEKWKEIKEKQWDTDLGLIVISGKPGAGTSSAAKILASLYNAELYKAGDTVREMAGNKERAGGFIERDPEIDHAVDAQVRRMTMNAVKGRPAIAEAQIGGATALETIQGLETEGKYPVAPIIRILFWADKKERVRRLKAASDENGENKKYLEILKRTTNRERDDLAYWRNLYPNLIGEDNPLNKNAKDARGNPIYNVPAFDNTEWKTPERSAYEVHKLLTETGLVRPKIEMQPDQSIFLGYRPEDNYLADPPTDIVNPW